MSFWKSAGCAVATVVGFNALAERVGQRWLPVALPEQLKARSTDTAITDETFPQFDIIQEIVEIDVDGVTVRGKVTRPKTDVPVPTAVFMHGAGSAIHIIFEPQARALARAGIAALVPDKRLDNYSTGIEITPPWAWTPWPRSIGPALKSGAMLPRSGYMQSQKAPGLRRLRPPPIPRSPLLWSYPIRLCRRATNSPSLPRTTCANRRFRAGWRMSRSRFSLSACPVAASTMAPLIRRRTNAR